MKIVASLAVALVAVALLASCKKEKENEAGPNSEDLAKADEFKSFVVSKKFQILEYYSDKPIDYNEEDSVVKSETDLLGYVSVWIKDDLNTFDFGSNTVTIEQNAHKIPGNDADTIVKDISVGADKDGPYFNFLNYQYNPLKYHIVEFNTDYFLVYADWHSGAKVYTKFAVKP